MATNPLGAVKLPAYVTDVRKREAALPPPPTPPPTAPPPEPTTSPMDAVTKFLRSTPEEQGSMLPPKVQAVGRGITRGIGEVGTSITEPKNLATLGAITAATAFAPPVVLGLLGMGFTIEGIHQLAKKVPAATEAFKAGNIEEGTRLLTTAVPDLAMTIPGIHAAPALAERAAGAIGAALPQGGILSPQAAESGFTTIDFLSGGKLLGRDHVMGSERVGGTKPETMHNSMQLAQKPDAVVADIRTPPKTSTELPTVLDFMTARGVDPTTASFKTPEGKILRFDELPQQYPEVAEWAQKAGITPPPTPAGAPPTVPTPPVPSYRTPSGRVGTVTDPMKLQRRGELEIKQAQAQAATLPEPAKAAKAGKVRQPRFPMEEVPQPEAAPAAAPSPEIPGSALERAIAAMLEHNRLLSRRLDLMEKGMSARDAEAVATAEAPAPKAATPKAPAAKAAAPAVPTTPGVTTPPGDLAAQIQQSIQEAPKVELTAAELKGMGATPGKKKGPVSYVGKTLEEKYAPKEAAAQPEAIKAAQTPRNQAELRDAIDAFNRGEGRPVNIVRRGLGSAKATRGVVLENIKDMKGKPTEFYSYMPDNWSGDPFPIRIKEMEPSPMGKTHEMNVPRHAQRTYDLGMEVAVARKPDIVKGQRVRLPDGSLGTHVDNVTGGPNAIKYFMKNLEEAAKGGDPTAQTRYELFKSKLATKGYPQLARVAMDDGRWIDFAPEELTQVGPEKVTTTQPAKQIKPMTEAAEQAAAKGISAATPVTKQVKVPLTREEIEAGERPVTRTITGIETPAQPPKLIQEEGAGISGAAIAKARGIKPPPIPEEELRGTKPHPEQTYKGQRAREMAIEAEQRRRMEYKPGATEAVKPTPPPGTPAKAVEAKAPEAADALTRVLNKYKEQLKPLEETEAKRGFKLRQADELRSKIKNIESRMAAPKTSAKLSEPAPTKPYTQPSTATKIPPPPSQVKATSAGGSTDSWTLTHPKGGSMEVRFTDDGVYVEQVRVPPEAQRTGVASEMYEQLGRMMKDRGIPGKNIEGNIQGPPDVVSKLRAKAARVAGAGKPSSSRYDID